MSLLILRNSQKWSFARAGRAGRQWFGWNEHLGQPVYDAWNNSSWTFRDIGARLIRDGLSWDLAEPSAGNYQFRPTGGSPLASDIFNFIGEQIANGHEFVFLYVFAYGSPVWGGDTSSDVWRQHYADWVVDTCTQLLAAGLPANRILVGGWNEPNSAHFGNYGWHQSSGPTDPTDPARYPRTMQAVRTRVKALNPGIRLAWGEMVDGDHGFYSGWRATIEADASYFPSMDVLVNHLYSNNDPYVGALASPEVLFNRCSPYFQQQLANAAAAGRTDITTGITENGWTFSEQGWPTVQANCSRQSFLYSLLPGFEFLAYYTLRDNTNDFGITEGDAYTRRPQANVLRDVWATTNIATERTQYTDPRGGVAVKMSVPDAAGRERVAVWNTLGSTVADLLVETYASGGTLSVLVPGFGVEATHPLALGVNRIPGVKMTPHARILYADTPIKFVSMP